MKNLDEWVMGTEYITNLNSESQEYALNIYASWIVRAILRKVSVKTGTSHLTANYENPDLTSVPVNCTLGTSSSCNSGGSNK